MTVEEMIRNSQCFGVAFDKHVPECRACDVKLKCEAKCHMVSSIDSMRPTPTLTANVSEIVDGLAKGEVKAKAKASPKKTVKDTVVTKNYDAKMPEFKSLTVEELEKMAVERGADLADFEKFKAANIRRMRLTMYLKKTYEV